VEQEVVVWKVELEQVEVEQVLLVMEVTVVHLIQMGMDQVVAVAIIVQYQHRE